MVVGCEFRDISQTRFKADRTGDYQVLGASRKPVWLEQRLRGGVADEVRGGRYKVNFMQLFVDIDSE